MIVFATMPDPSGGRAARALAISFHKTYSKSGCFPSPPTSRGQASASQLRAPSAEYNSSVARSVLSLVMEEAVGAGEVLEKSSDLGLELPELGSEIKVHVPSTVADSSPVVHTGSRFSTNALGPSLKSGWSQCIRSSAQPYSRLSR